MRTQSRNRILTIAVLLIYTVLLIAFCWVFVTVDRSAGWVVAIGLVATYLYVLWRFIVDMRELSRIENALQESGVELPDEQPIPIRFAKNRESLYVSLAALLILLAVFVAHYAGWLRVGQR